MKKFTLVEILVVIAVIGILASLILPAVTGANQQTMRLKAKADVSNIMSAIVKYESTYGKLPVLMDGNKPNDDYFGNNDAGKLGRLTREGYYALVQSLSGVDIASDNEIDLDGDWTEINYPTSDTDLRKAARAMNPRKTPFLDVPSDFPKNGFVDPWGNEYVIILDYEIDPPHTEYEGTNNIAVSPYDKIIEHPALSANDGNAVSGISENNGFLKLSGSSAQNTGIPTVVRANVIVYSKGANNTDDGGLDVTVSNSFDDINSWSELQ